MSGIIECAVLQHCAKEDWLGAWMARHVNANPRLYLHTYELTPTSDGLPSVHALRDAALTLRRYDVAILPVSYPSLSWTRMALAGVMQHQQTLPIPLIALVDGLRAPAIQDLFELGVTDFLREDDGLDDLRARVTQMASAGWRRTREISNRSSWFGRHADAPTLLAEPSRFEHTDDAAISGAMPDGDETFRIAKTRVIARFERDYIDKALSRHAGNISMAARSAQKHRRAFWALMRKHRIDAAPYRQIDSLAAPE